MNQIEIFKDNNGLYGIRKINTGEVFVECKYKSIDKIKHHNDLTTVNFEEWFLFFEDNYLDAQFGYISNGVVFISKNKYQKLKHFYKELTYCIFNNEWVIINTNETVLAKSSDFKQLSDFGLIEYNFLFSILESSHNKEVILDLTKELCHELFRFFEITFSIEFNFKKDYGYRWVSSRLEAYFIPLIVEEKLGIRDGSPLISGEFKELSDYDPYTGNFFVKKENDRLAFINKYMYQVGENFDEFFDKEVIKDYLSQNYIDFEKSKWDKIKSRVDFIGEDGKIYLIEHTGDFILESLFYPKLFCEYSFAQKNIRQIFNTDNADLIEFTERVYHKFDKGFITKEIELKKNTNPQFKESDEWINEILESNIENLFDNQGYAFCLPFEWDNDNEEECRNLIRTLNDLVGVSYSSYKIIGEVGKYDFVNNQLLEKWNAEKMINVFSVLN